MSKCERCGEEKEDIIDGLCEECEEYMVYCSICDEHLGEDDARYHHRHLFYDEEEHLWLGVGGEDTEDHLPQIKASFLALLKKTGMAIPLRDTIRRNDMGFDTIHLWGTGFGYSRIFCWLQAENEPHGRDYGDRFLEEDEPMEEALAYGVQWLIGLDNDKTPAANALTLAWIEEALNEVVS